MNNRKNGFFALSALLALAGALQAQSQTPDVTKPVISRAAVNTTTNQLVIQGSHLKPASGSPTVQIGGGTMSLVSYDAGQIIAAFPEDLYSIGGSFVIKVIAGGTGTFDLALPTPGPQGPPGADGATGPAGPQGPPGTLTMPFTSLFEVQNSQGPAIIATAGFGDGIGAYGGNSAGNGVSGYGGNGGGDGVLGSGGNSPFGGIGVHGVGSPSGAGGVSGPGGVFRGGGDPNDGAAGGGDGVDAIPGSNSGVGIYASSGRNSEGGPNMLAGVFEGDVTVQGNLSKSGGSFQIDHPLDPANKYLYHSFVESPDMKNVYDGTVTTDGGGNATVTLPDWFETLNRDFRYQLTTIGQLCQATILSEITHNTFTIKTDKPNVKVSWQVTGIRQDAWANAHRIPVEMEKDKADQGHYLHPELFEHPGEPSIPQLHHPMPKRPQPSAHP